MSSWLVKVEYGPNKFGSFLIDKNLTFQSLVDGIKSKCSTLSHILPTTVRIRYKDDDGDLVNLPYGDEFALNELRRSAKLVPDRDYKKISLKANELDSPNPKEYKGLKATPLSKGSTGTIPSRLSYGTEQVTQPHFSPYIRSPAAPASTSEGDSLDRLNFELLENVQIFQTKLKSAGEELAKLNKIYSELTPLSSIRARICSNCHVAGHTKSKCVAVPCGGYAVCKLKDKHPEPKNQINQLQKEIKTIQSEYENAKMQMEKFTSSRERSKTSFFSVMRPRLKAQNLPKYTSRLALDRDLLVLERAFNKKVPDWDPSEDWRLPLAVEQYKHSNVRIYTDNLLDLACNNRSSRIVSLLSSEEISSNERTPQIESNLAGISHGSRFDRSQQGNAAYSAMTNINNQGQGVRFSFPTHHYSNE